MGPVEGVAAGVEILGAEVHGGVARVEEGWAIGGCDEGIDPFLCTWRDWLDAFVVVPVV